MRVALMVTCRVDLLYPPVEKAAYGLLQQLGRQGEVPLTQTCRGQPAYNAGYRKGAQAAFRATLRVFRRRADVVVPSGSCAT